MSHSSIKGYTAGNIMIPIYIRFLSQICLIYWMCSWKKTFYVWRILKTNTQSATKCHVPRAAACATNLGDVKYDDPRVQTPTGL